MNRRAFLQTTAAGAAGLTASAAQSQRPDWNKASSGRFHIDDVLSSGDRAATLRITAALALNIVLVACGGGSDPVAPKPGPTNRAPTTSGPIPAQTIPANTLAQGESVRLDVRQFFSDPDGDALTY